MRNLFILAAVAGVAIAGAIYYIMNSETGQVIDVEDELTIDA